jgi:hypothetical protein
MMALTFTYRDVTHLVTNPTGKHVNVYVSGTRVAEMWSDRLGNWYASCWVSDHQSTRGIRGGMTAGQVVQYVETHVRRQHPEIREHDYSIVLAMPRTWMCGWDGSYDDMRECRNCGQRVLADSLASER